MLIAVTIMPKFIHISSQNVLLCASESVLGVRSNPGTCGGGQLSPESRYPAVCKAAPGRAALARSQ